MDKKMSQKDLAINLREGKPPEQKETHCNRRTPEEYKAAEKKSLKARANKFRPKKEKLYRRRSVYPKYSHKDSRVMNLRLGEENQPESGSE
jgi:hypothetical protein